MIAKYAKQMIALILTLVMLTALPVMGEAEQLDEQILVDISASHPVLDGVIYLNEGDTVEIETTPSCSDPEATFVYFWLLGTKDADGNFVEEALVSREGTYSFVASADMHGKYLSYSTGRTGYRPGSFELKLNVAPKVAGEITLDIECSHPVVDNTLTADEEDVIIFTANASCTVPDVELNYTWYIETENNGEWEKEKQDCTDKTFSITASEDLNEKYIMCLVTPKVATEIVPAQFECQLIIVPLKPITLKVTPRGGDLGWMPNQNTKYMYDGESIPFVAQATYEGAGIELSYSWYLETRDANGNVTKQVKLDCTESTYNLVASVTEHSQKYLTCHVEGEGLEPASCSVKLSVTYRSEGKITLNPKTSHPVEDNVLTATEGETVTIASNPTSPLDDAQYVYFWFLEEHDENGKTIAEEKLACNGDTLTLPVSMDMNGKYIYCSVGSDRLKPGSFTYQLKILPKPVEPEEDYKTVVEEGITSDALSEELKANPDLNTPEKIEADITIKVVSKALSNGVETTSEQTAVYDVTLMYSEDGGNTYVEATKENWPESGRLTVTLPYPAGTGRYTHTFVVAHMFTETTAAHKAGEIEYPVVTNTANGIQFEVTGLSPIAIAWEEKAEEPAVVPATGDTATPFLWMLGMMLTGMCCAALLNKRRQNG